MTATIPCLEAHPSRQLPLYSFYCDSSIMDTIRSASVTSARVRTDAAFKNRWQTLFKNPKILIIAFFAS
jgi:hypothetical protein